MMEKSSFRKLLEGISLILISLIMVIDNEYLGYILSYIPRFLFGLNYIVFCLIVLGIGILKIILSKKEKYNTLLVFCFSIIFLMGICELFNYYNYYLRSYKPDLNIYKASFLDYLRYFEFNNYYIGFVGKVINDLFNEDFSLTICIIISLIFILFGVLGIVVYFTIPKTDKEIVDTKEDKLEEIIKQPSNPYDSLEDFDVFNDDMFSKTNLMKANAESSANEDFDVFNDDSFGVSEEKAEKVDVEVIKHEENSNIIIEEQQFISSTNEVPSINGIKEPLIENINNLPIEEEIEEPIYIEEKLEEKEIIKEEVKENKQTVSYPLPSISLLKNPQYMDTSENNTNADVKAVLLNSKLASLGINGKVVGHIVAPAFTRFEIEVESNVKINQIPNCKNDLMMALSAEKINILAPIPGTSYVGIDIPNIKRSAVTFKECLTGIPFDQLENKLIVTLGKDINGKVVNIKLNDAPHLLVAGATGSGKSVCLNTIVSTLIMRTLPSEVSLMLIDPKRVDLKCFSTIPHLICPIITDIKQATVALKRASEEMFRRYDEFSNTDVRNIEGYNKKMESLGKEKMKYIVIIIDEFADLILENRGEVEEVIKKLTSLARSAGIHLIVATQKPVVDVIDGVIKGNIPSRIGFAVASAQDSRIILDESGAEELLGKGDMLVKMNGSLTTRRVQGCYITDEEIDSIVAYVASQSSPNYDPNFLDLVEKEPEQLRFEELAENDKSSDDQIYEKILEFLHSVPIISVSMLRRKFILGQPRAARMIDRLEDDGYISKQDGNKPRTVYQSTLPDIIKEDNIDDKLPF